MKHLLDTASLSRDDAVGILDIAEEMTLVSQREVKKLPVLRGRTVVNLFFEDSTRTRLSFEAAAKRLSADVLNFSAKGSSVSKGESLQDTIQTISAMGADAIVVRHSGAGTAHRLAHTGWIDVPVVNAGDGTHEHPTQALLDAFTLRRVSVPVLPVDASPIRILQIADLHLTPKNRARREWVSRLAGLEPDLVINTGDNLAHPDAVPYVLEALGRADWIIVGPGSWYTSVLPHLMIPEIAEAIRTSPARVCITTNLSVGAQEAEGMTSQDMLEVLVNTSQGCRFDALLADPTTLDDAIELAEDARSRGIKTLLRQVSVGDGTPHHDPVRLAAAYRDLFDDAYGDVEPAHEGAALPTAGHGSRTTEEDTHGSDG